MAKTSDQGQGTTETAAPGGKQEGSSLVTAFLDFLDRHFTTFKPGVQNLIGIVLLALLAIISLHAFVAPTVVRGRLFIVEKEGGDKSFARFTKMSTGDRDLVTDDAGRWVIQVRGLIPQKLSIDVHRPDAEGGSHGTFLGEFVLWEPKPIVSAFAVAEYRVVVHPYRKESERRVEIGQLDVDRPLTFLAGLFPRVGAAQAQTLPGAPRILVNVEGLGDVACSDGGWCGTRGENRRLEGFSIRLPEKLGDVRATYGCDFQDGKVTRWVTEGELCGARGPGRRLEGLAVRLSGADAGRYSIVYQAHLRYHGDTPVFRNGEVAAGKGPASQMEAIKVWLEPLR